MEPQRKRTPSVLLPSETMSVFDHFQDGGEPAAKRPSPLYLPQSEMSSFLEDYPVSQPAQSIQNSLQQLEEDVSSIKSSLVKKRSKVTLNQLNIKVDMIIEILKEWSSFHETLPAVLSSGSTA